MQSKTSKRTIRRTSPLKVKESFIPLLPSVANRPRMTAEEIERWMLGMGFKPLRGRELAEMKRRGKIGMPEE